jgi:hypothetical protein
VPRSWPRQLSVEQEALVVRARERTKWGPMRLAAVTGRIARCYRRFEWSQPGALLHIDAYSAP